ncbi:MAG: hydroxyacid dehydrogenase [Planctomycetes bacterium]|jgi:D-lactate dehydrogenase|nr:hydroxyacid dehydrogenase [Phycisphaerae bacterium]NBB95785.1 hydroxyacid dehydrogenase [Planctomycetota bacterium]
MVECIYDEVQRNATILFVEFETWEQDQLEDICPNKCTITCTPKRLGDVPEEEIPDGVNVLSPFIHSDVTGEQLERLGDLKLIATRSTGFDHIDMDYCREHGIRVANVPTYGENTVAEHAFGMLLALTRKIHRCYERTSAGDFSLEGLRGTDLAGKTFGCLGVGNIGAKAMRIAGGFGMNRIAFDVQKDPIASGELGLRYVDFETLLAEADVLSIHVPLNDKTEHLIDADALKKMKSSAILVNTARGGVVDTDALIKALKDGDIGGAALDVLEAETIVGEEAEMLSSSYDVETLRTVVQNHTLLKMPNVIITPHNAFNSEEALQRIIRTTVQNIHGWMAGEPENVVNA